MQHVGAIEAAIGKRHRQRAALMQGYALIEPNPVAQGVAGLDVFSGQIHAGDLTPVSAGDEAGGTAEAAPNVENVHLSRESELIEKFLRSLASADVELVDGGKIIDRDIVCRLPKRGYARAYRLDKTAMRVVPRHIGLRGHYLAP